jgi:SAM-dependent methyltransferase
MKENNFSKCLRLLELFFSKDNKSDIFEKFCFELMQTGYNVRRDCTVYNVKPHVYNQEMTNLYSKSDAFIYELLVGSLEVETIKKDDFIINKIKEYFKGKNKINILCFGDGIGSDSLKFSKLGFKVTYFDIEGKLSNFAKLNFRINKVENLIQTVFDESCLIENAYDVIICREVLEHLERPFETVKRLRSFLKNNGLFFLSESFSSVNANFPTHLSSNLKYAKKTINMTVKEGFEFLESYNQTNLNMFKKEPMLDNSRFLSIPKKPLKLRFKKKIRDIIIYLLS